MRKLTIFSFLSLFLLVNICFILYIKKTTREIQSLDSTITPTTIIDNVNSLNSNTDKTDNTHQIIEPLEINKSLYHNNNNNENNNLNNNNLNENNFCNCIENGGKTILLFNKHYQITLQNAKKGGPFGELAVYLSVLKGLQYIYNNQNFKNKICHLDISYSESELKEKTLINLQNKIKKCTLQQLQKSNLSEQNIYHLLFIETYSFQDLLNNIFNIKDNSHIWHDHFSKFKCRYRILDFWGTPESQNHEKLNLKQYLIPYPNKYNQFIGYIVDKCFENENLFFYKKNLNKLNLENYFVENYFIEDKNLNKNLENKKLEFLIWGKELKYFHNQKVINFLKNLNSKFNNEITIYATVKDNLDHLPFIKNLGVLNKENWLKSLQKAHFVIGLGDPVIGPTAFDAISCGAIFLNPIFDQPRTLYGMNKELTLSNQHPYAEEFIGLPYVIPFRFEMNSLDEIFFSSFRNSGNNDEEKKKKAVLKEVLEGKRKLKGLILGDYTLGGVVKRLLEEVLPMSERICGK
ncbi:hypothetical protein ABK040_012778 [Willaertia magna]